MKFLFIDETEKFGQFGVSAVLIDHSKYPIIKKSIWNELSKYKWSFNEEFKSTQIFSSSTGDINVTVAQRMELAKRIMKTNIGEKNNRLKAYFCYSKAKRSQDLYCKLLEKIIKKLPKATNSKNGKNLIAIFVDELDGGHSYRERACKSINKLSERDYLLVDYPSFVKSSNHTTGILLADHIAFVANWKILSKQDKDREVSEIKKKKNEFISELHDQIGEINKFKVEKC